MVIYDIALKTPLGRKSGELVVSNENGKLSGFLSLLGHTEPIEGIVEENGKCSLKGTFVTLLNTICFTADGVINGEVLNLKIRSGSGTYEMVGALRRGQESDRQ